MPLDQGAPDAPTNTHTSTAAPLERDGRQDRWPHAYSLARTRAGARPSRAAAARRSPPQRALPTLAARGELDQPDRAMVRVLDRRPAAPLRSPQRARARERHPKVGQGAEREPPAVCLEQARRRDPRLHPTTSITNLQRGPLAGRMTSEIRWRCGPCWTGIWPARTSTGGCRSQVGDAATCHDVVRRLGWAQLVRDVRVLLPRTASTAVAAARSALRACASALAALRVGPRSDPCGVRWRELSDPGGWCRTERMARRCLGWRTPRRVEAEGRSTTSQGDREAGVSFEDGR
jgi:hypothetical protein